MTDPLLEYRQVYHAIVSKAGGIKRWSEGGPPVLYETSALAAKSCTTGQGEFVVAVRLLWKQPPP